MFSISVCLVWSNLASSGLVWSGLFLLELRDERDPQPPSITAQSLLDIEISRSQTVEAPLSVSSTGGAQPQTDQPAANPWMAHANWWSFAFAPRLLADLNAYMRRPYRTNCAYRFSRTGRLRVCLRCWETMDRSSLQELQKRPQRRMGAASWRRLTWALQRIPQVLLRLQQHTVLLQQAQPLSYSIPWAVFNAHALKGRLAWRNPSR